MFVIIGMKISNGYLIRTRLKYIIMEKVKELSNFFETIRDDPRIGPTHISLYMAFFQLYNMKGFQNPIHFTRNEIMEMSKIRGIATYHKCINDLSQLGYIEYCPSYNSVIQSRAVITFF